MSAVEKAQAVHKTIVGVCESFEVKNDWHNYSIRVDGNQYPTKLSTKKPELIALAAAVGNQRAEWGFLESQGGENPNRPGTFYMNRWLDSAAVVDGQTPIEETPQAPHPADSADAPPPAVDWDAKDLRRHRQAAVAIAVSSFQANSAIFGEEALFMRADKIVRYVYGEPEELVDAAQTSLLDPEDVPF